MKRKEFGEIQLKYSTKKSRDLEETCAGFFPYFRGTSPMGSVQKNIERKVIHQWSDFVKYSEKIHKRKVVYVVLPKSIDDIPFLFTALGKLPESVEVQLIVHPEKITKVYFLQCIEELKEIKNRQIKWSFCFDIYENPLGAPTIDVFLELLRLCAEHQLSVCTIEFINTPKPTMDIKQSVALLHLLESVIVLHLRMKEKSMFVEDFLEKISFTLSSEKKLQTLCASVKTLRVLWALFLKQINVSVDAKYLKIDLAVTPSMSKNRMMHILMMHSASFSRLRLAYCPNIESKYKNAEKFLNSECFTNQVIDAFGGDTQVDKKAQKWIKKLGKILEEKFF